MDSRKELEELEYRYYNEMKDGTRKVKISESSLFRCPFCYIDRKRDYRFEDLLRHASFNIGSSDLREKARHLALKRYISKYLQQPTPDNQDSSKFVYPWKGILANVTGAYKERSGRKVKEELINKGFNPLKVETLWNRYGHTGFAIVEFGKEWEGFRYAMKFETYFEMNHCGKRNYYGDRDRGDKLYGWIAKEEEYYLRNVVGDNLRKKGDLKTVSGKEEEDKRKALALETHLKNTLESRSNSLREMESKYEETSNEFEKTIKEKEELIKEHNRKMCSLQQQACDYLESIDKEHEEASQKLEAKRLEYEARERELDKCHEQNMNERRELEREKQKNLMETQEQNKANEDMARLADQQQMERGELSKTVLELQQKLEDMQKSELEIERMKGYLKVKGHMKEGEADPEIEKTVKELKEKEEELEYQEWLYQRLVVKHGYTNDELQGARKALINSIQVLKISNDRHIGVKKMGELDVKPFRKVEADDVKAVELCSLWDEYLRDSGWHPFKVKEKNGSFVEVLDEEGDERLQGLKRDLGDEVYEAVTKALKERNEYNGSGRYIVPELWNFGEGRKASIREGVVYLLSLWKKLKPKPTTLKRKRG